MNGKAWEMSSGVDPFLTLINSAFVYDHSSNPSWPSLAQGIQWAKNPWSLARSMEQWKRNWP